MLARLVEPRQRPNRVLAVYANALAGGSRYGLGGGFTHMGRRLRQARTQAEANTGTVAFVLTHVPE